MVKRIFSSFFDSKGFLRFNQLSIQSVLGVGTIYVLLLSRTFCHIIFMIKKKKSRKIPFRCIATLMNWTQNWANVKIKVLMYRHPWFVTYVNDCQSNSYLAIVACILEGINSSICNYLSKLLSRLRGATKQKSPNFPSPWWHLNGLALSSDSSVYSWVVTSNEMYITIELKSIISLKNFSFTPYFNELNVAKCSEIITSAKEIIWTHTWL